MAESDEKKYEHYLRLLSFIIGPATETLQLFFEIKVLNSLDFFSFLEKHKHVLFHELHSFTPCCHCQNFSIRSAHRKGLLTKDQFDLLFETDESYEMQSHKITQDQKIKEQLCLCGVSAKLTTTVDVIDIPLLSALIQSCCPPEIMFRGSLKWIKDINEARNYIAHFPSNKMTKFEFDQQFSVTEQAVLDLAGVVGPVLQKMIKIQISQFKMSELSTIKDTIKNSNESEKIIEMFVEEQKECFKSSARQIRNITENTDAIKTDVLSQSLEKKVIVTNIRNIESEGDKMLQREQSRRTVSQDSGVCYVEWTIPTPCSWKVDEIKNTLEKFSPLIGKFFPVVFIYRESDPIPSMQFDKEKLHIFKDSVGISDVNMETKHIEKKGPVVSQEYCDSSVDRLFKIPFSFGLDLIIDRRLEEEYSKLIKTNMREKGIDDNGTYSYMEEFVHMCELRKRYQNFAMNPRDDLTDAIQKGKEICARWLLSNFNFENIFAKEFQTALEVKDTRMAKTLAWTITNKFFSKFKKILNLTKFRIWPGFRCICNSKDVQRICSNQFEIIIESGNSVKDIPVEFEGFKVRQLPYEKESIEAKVVTNSLSKYWKSEACCDNILIPGKEAESLFDNHSNLSLICSSTMISTGMPYNQRISPVPCIQLHCTVKRVIPIGERHFPSFICQYPTDVLEGCPVLATEIKIGEKIGTLDSTGKLKSQGTLGGFLDHFGFPCFLTCAHVVCNLETLLGRISNDIDSSGINVFKPFASTNNAPVQCGRVIKRVFEHSDKDKTSIDAALVNIIQGVTVDPKECIHGQFGFTTSMKNLGISSLKLNEICIDIANICNSKVDVLCPGGFMNIKDKVKITPPEDYVEVQFPPDGGPVQQGYAQPLMIATTAHMQLNASNLAGQRVFRMYNQLLLNIPLNLGDSGTCIYVIDNTEQRKGCLGMAIAFLSSGQCVITPLKEILKKLKH